jgi:protein SCO1/2
MLPHGMIISAVLSTWLISTCVNSAAESLTSSNPGEATLRSFTARGVVKQLKADDGTILLSHEAISNYMDAMTMPFKVKEPKELTDLRPGDQVSFRLSVTDTESWIDQVAKITASTPRSAPLDPLEERVEERMLPIATHHPLLDYKFTNELGQQVSLSDFRGQALAITFFFTRCPIPDYCPRLSKNFQVASTKLGLITAGPTNWHFLSVSFDTQFDSPRVLKAYGEMYHYDPAHWSFLAGSAESVGELARLSDVKFEREAGSFSHNFRTLIIDAAGHLQMVFPTGGDLSSAIVDEMLKAANVTNRSLEHASRSAPSP